MPKQINVYNNESLSELDWQEGEIVAFDNTDPEYPLPLILTVPEKIVKDYREPYGIKLSFVPENKKLEKWTLYSDEEIIELSGPKRWGRGLLPCFDAVDIPKEGYGPYPVEYAIAGKDAIKNYLEKFKFGMNFYTGILDCMIKEEPKQSSKLEKFINEMEQKSL
jgi:hypothetical protein